MGGLAAAAALRRVGVDVTIYEQAEDGGWVAYLPDVPGVVALGTTREEVTSGIQEALGAYVECLDIRRALSAADPGNDGLRQDISVTSRKIDNVRAAHGDHAIESPSNAGVAEG